MTRADTTSLLHKQRHNDEVENRAKKREPLKTRNPNGLIFVLYSSKAHQNQQNNNKKLLGLKSLAYEVTWSKPHYDLEF